MYKDGTHVEVYEDDAGGLQLYILDGDEPIHMACGYDYPEQCAQDYASLVFQDWDPERDGWRDPDFDIAECYWGSTAREIACSADWDGDMSTLERTVDTYDLGAAGKAFARALGCDIED